MAVVCTLEMWPGGNRERAYPLGTVIIANSGGGTNDTGDYDVRLLKTASHGAKRAGDWRKGRVTGFPRRRLGAYDLLLRALVACAGERSREAVAALGDRTMGGPPLSIALDAVESATEARLAAVAALLAEPGDGDENFFERAVRLLAAGDAAAAAFAARDKAGAA